jgi:hypothetical protein
MKKILLIFIFSFSQYLIPDNEKHRHINIINNTNLNDLQVVWIDETAGDEDGNEHVPLENTVKIPKGYKFFKVTCHRINGCSSKLQQSGKDSNKVKAIPGKTYYVECPDDQCTTKLQLKTQKKEEPFEIANKELAKFFTSKISSSTGGAGPDFDSSGFGDF